jgi:hypothetical protein
MSFLFASRENLEMMASAYRDNCGAGSLAQAGICLDKAGRTETIPRKRPTEAIGA